MSLDYGYETIVNGYDCFCDCHPARCTHDESISCNYGESGTVYCQTLEGGSTCEIDGDVENVAQLDSCGVCSDGNTGLNANDIPSCLAGGTMHDFDEFNGSSWPRLDCNCECDAGTPKYESVHSNCGCVGQDGCECQNYGQAIIEHPFAYAYR